MRALSAKLFALCAGPVTLALAAAPAVAPPIPIRDIIPVRATQPVANDPDDPAIWVNPRDPAGSLILGTNKVKASEGGALCVFGLDGNLRQTIPNLDRPNNVDIEYGLKIGGVPTDIAVVTERLTNRLRVYRIPPDGGKLTELSSPGLRVFAGETGEQAAPMGIALYKRPKDRAVFAVVGRKTGPKQGYLWQYRLRDNGRGGVKASKVRAFGTFSGAGEIEAIAVDDALGYLYYADEGLGIRKYAADPDAKNANVELARFGTSGFQGDREGIALYARADGTGYLVCTDQVRGSSRYFRFRREGEPGNPHEHRVLGGVRGGADETDGAEMVATPLGPDFPSGLFVVMNSGPKNFLLFRAGDVLPKTSAAGRR
ncbi:MAG: phytase [Cytophagales bacterium]|nr:phytase [Armatimonadota bacterium]